MDKYKQGLIKQLQELQERKKVANSIDEVMYITFEMGVITNQLMLLEKEEKCY